MSSQNEALKRVALLIGEEGLEKLKRSAVLIVGVGGVGSYAAEALARSGIGKLILVDADQVALSNLNRQIMANEKTIGMDKCEAMKERILSYHKECEVICIHRFFDGDCEDFLDRFCPDYVIDAIDTVTSKMDLIQMCAYRKIPCISSLGMANRLDPSCLEVTTLDKTTMDPLAKALRQLAKKRNYTRKIRVVFSKEQPIKQNKMEDINGKTRKEMIPPSSMIFVPAAAGLLLGSFVTKEILKKEKYENH